MSTAANHTTSGKAKCKAVMMTTVLHARPARRRARRRASRGPQSSMTTTGAYNTYATAAITPGTISRSDHAAVMATTIAVANASGFQRRRTAAQASRSDAGRSGATNAWNTIGATIAGIAR